MDARDNKFQVAASDPKETKIGTSRPHVLCQTGFGDHDARLPTLGSLVRQPRQDGTRQRSGQPMRTYPEQGNMVEPLLPFNHIEGKHLLTPISDCDTFIALRISKEWLNDLQQVAFAFIGGLDRVYQVIIGRTNVSACSSRTLSILRARWSC